ncbi:NinE family protein, partial [Escherichia coli]|nr:NinE family protein [Escherichia coli]EKE6991547.1 NinE family protein [Escherichia coli]
ITDIICENCKYLPTKRSRNLVLSRIP